MQYVNAGTGIRTGADRSARVHRFSFILTINNTMKSATIHTLIQDVYKDARVSYREVRSIYEEVQRTERAVRDEEGTEGLSESLFHSFDITQYLLLTAISRLSRDSDSRDKRQQALDVVESNLLLLQANLDAFMDGSIAPKEVQDLDHYSDAHEVLAVENLTLDAGEYAVKALYQSLEVTVQLLQENVLRFRGGSYTDTARALVTSAVEANIQLLQAVLNAFR